MIEDFIIWFRNCLEYLGQLLSDAICQGFNTILDILAWIIVLIIVVAISPIWIPFFIFWWFFKR